MKLLNGRRHIRRWLDWTRPKEDYQWKSGRSAMELARAWFTSTEPVMPVPLRRILDGNRTTKGLRIATGRPEKVTPLPERGEGRNHDLVLYGRVRRRSAVVCIEAKVDEEFGPLVGQYHKQKSRSRSRVPARIEKLSEIIFGEGASPLVRPWRDLRYQLLTGAAGSVLEAEQAGADFAVFVVHEFITESADRKRKVPRHHKEFVSFVRALTRDSRKKVARGRLYGPVQCVTPRGREIDLFIGKITDDWAS